jgi:hypothetical protein
LDEKMSKHASLAQENGFSSGMFAVALKWATTTLCCCMKTL